MKIQSKLTTLFVHSLLIISLVLIFMPLYFALIAASHEGAALMHSPLPVSLGSSFFHNMTSILGEGIVATGGQPVWRLLANSLIMALLIAFGKILLSLFSAFALVYFNLPFKKCVFAIIFSTMMLPVEVRIVPTFQVIASFGWLNTFSGLSLPLMVSATATFLFRQFFKTLPSELVDAAQLDGATPWRFFWDILLPLARTQVAALFIILFVYGWNQYLWPLVITSDTSMGTIVMGIRYLAGVADQIPQWHYIMCVALLAMLPPCVVVITMQRWFEKGLIH
jgi:sn-glycerol 3-phosphate transport system permease protein